ncbi:hypothetical protein ADIS_0920 [Lunatimonas lonarensis]|uniref:Uncharacterized protein n=1 Tax=Lunatimonas lonarensis TaxID=1232681 RepID=R7ZWP9_9BACT|nr:hypothetical protein ADIS_0920 [Lunatimonas lonarensis]
MLADIFPFSGQVADWVERVKEGLFCPFAYSFGMIKEKENTSRISTCLRLPGANEGSKHINDLKTNCSNFKT